MKKIISIIVLLTVAASGYGQKRTTSFLNDDYKKTVKDSASYFNVSFILADSTKVGLSITYFISAKKHIEGVYKDNNRIGLFNYYFENGNVLKTENYLDGRLDGNFDEWYENGNKREEGVYTSGKYAVENFWDSTNVLLLSKGTGDYYSLHNNGRINEQGEYKAHKKNGEWVGYHKNGKLYYKEKYSNEELVKGVSYDELGQSYKYTKMYGTEGLDEFYKYVARKMEYPANARERGVEGRVFVEFVVEKNGQVSNERIIKGIGAGCDKEVLRMIRSLPDDFFEPLTTRGQPEKQKIVLPIIFQLG